MARSYEIEDRVNKYAANRLRELRGEVTRVKFGARVDLNENVLYAYESGRTPLPLARVASIADVLGVPLSTFILPDDDDIRGNAENKEKIEA